jgi:hypothetical protein
MLVSAFLAYLLINPVVPAQVLYAPPAPAAPPVFAPEATPMPAVPPQATCEASCTMVNRVYPVADLVVPIAGTPGAAPATVQVAAPACPAPGVTANGVQPQHTMEGRLMAIIRAQVAPGSWVSNGAAAMSYEPISMALVVRQTPQRQKQIARLLKSLRHAQDTEVVVEVRMIAVPAQVNRFGADRLPGGVTDSGSAPPLFLDSKNMQSFLNLALADRRTNVLAMPKLTVANGQDATIEMTKQEFFVTDLKETQCNGGVIYLPNNRPFTTGISFHIQPVASADGQYVKMRFAGKDTEVAEKPSLVPVTSFVTPKFEGGAEGQPVPFTQFVQCPTFNCQQFERTLVVPDGETAVFLGWKTTRPTTPLVPEVLGDLPFVSCLFLNACQPAQQTENVLLMVTPHILTHEEMEVKRPAAVASCPTTSPLLPAVYEQVTPEPANPRLMEFLASYQAACVRGDRAAATQWAVRALAVDPTCFQKK